MTPVACIKHATIVNYASCAINKLEALLTDDARVVIYDRHVFIVEGHWSLLVENPID